jgi:hypothetical protein
MRGLRGQCARNTGHAATLHRAGFHQRGRVSLSRQNRRAGLSSCAEYVPHTMLCFRPYGLGVRPILHFPGVLSTEINDLPTDLSTDGRQAAPKISLYRCPGARPRLPPAARPPFNTQRAVRHDSQGLRQRMRNALAGRAGRETRGPARRSPRFPAPAGTRASRTQETGPRCGRGRATTRPAIR